MTFFEDLKARGLVHDWTDQPGMLRALEAGGMTLYCGFDPTAESLHVGSLMPIVGLMRFQRAGHRPIAVIGGATGMIGDPSGKSEERNLLDAPALARNIAGVRRQLAHFLGGAPILDNADWLGGLKMIDFLREVGKHFTLGYMLAKESVKNRIAEAGISYTEFSYMIFQAYDYLHLFDKENCTLQIGGSDQWGNITAGIELIRRARFGKEAYGITFPLITMSSGAKFGKTEEGNVWLDPEKTSPYQFYQYWMRAEDKDVGRFLRYFTFLSLEEIAQAERAHAKNPEAREGQRRLAGAMTALVHGEEAARVAERASGTLFTGNVEDIEEDVFLTLAGEIPTSTITILPSPLVDTLVNTELSRSKSMARKDLQSGSIYVNNSRVSDETASLTQADLRHGKYALLRKGKKNYHLLQFNP